MSGSESNLLSDEKFRKDGTEDAPIKKARLRPFKNMIDNVIRYSNINLLADGRGPAPFDLNWRPHILPLLDKVAIIYQYRIMMH